MDFANSAFRDFIFGRQPKREDVLMDVPHGSVELLTPPDENDHEEVTARHDPASTINETSLEHEDPEAPAQAVEEEDPFKKWVREQGLENGVSSEGQGGRSRDYMEELQNILMSWGGMHYSPSFSGEQIAAAGGRSGASDALRAQEAANNAARTNAYLASQDRAAAAGERKAEGDAAKLDLSRQGFGLDVRKQEEAERANRAREAAALKAAEAKRAAGAAAAQRKAAAAEEKSGKKSTEGLPVDWEVVEGANPTKQQNQDFGKVESTDRRVNGLIARVREGLKESGAGRVLPGPARASLEQLATMLQIEGKDVAGLGALSGPDMALMNSIVANPTSMDSFVKDIPRSLDNVQFWSNNRVKSLAESTGYRRKAKGGSPSAGATGTINIRKKGGGPSVAMTPTEAKQYLDSGRYEEAK